MNTPYINIDNVTHIYFKKLQVRNNIFFANLPPIEIMCTPLTSDEQYYELKMLRDLFFAKWLNGETFATATVSSNEQGEIVATASFIQ